MKSIYLTLRKNRIHTWCFGEGETLLIAFHGYGESGHMFLPLASILRPYFRVYALDLPFHGKTIWNEKEYSRDSLGEMIQMILDYEGKTTYQMLGYSLGGRLILSVFPECPGRPNALFLIAPDGLNTRGMQLPELLPIPFRHWVADHTVRSQRLLSLAEKLHKLKLFPTHTIRFLRKNLASPERRKRLIHTWLSLDQFPVDLNVLVDVLEERAVTIGVALSKEDKVVPEQEIRKAFEEFPNVYFGILNGGHYQLINAALGKWIISTSTVSDES